MGLLERAPDWVGRGVATSAVWFYTGLTALVDASPDAVRFGIGRAIRSRLLARPVPALHEMPSVVAVRERSQAATGRKAIGAAEARATAVLITRSLGTGGVEAVVAMLARNLAQHDVEVLVICEAGGSTADSLREDQIRVAVCPDLTSTKKELSGFHTMLVAQLHNAPEHAITACRDLGVPMIPVVHTVDVNLDHEQWAAERRLLQGVPMAVAVSRTVRDFYLDGLGGPVTTPVRVIPNGVDVPSLGVDEQADARRRLAQVVQTDLREATVLVCLARYDLQKNIPGLVASFLRAASCRRELHLVVAGPIQDWLEYRLATALCTGHPAGARVHLMGTSSGRDLLASADAVILNSFYEGWPIALTEAAAAGVPVLTSDVGGASEIVGPNNERGYRFANPAGDPRSVSLAIIRAARRRVRHQRNATELTSVLVELCDQIDSWRHRRAELANRARSTLGLDQMVSAHADVLMQVAASSDVHRRSHAAGLALGAVHTWSAMEATGPNNAQNPTASS